MFLGSILGRWFVIIRFFKEFENMKCISEDFVYVSERYWAVR